MSPRTATKEPTPAERPAPLNGLEAFTRVFEEDWAALPLPVKLSKIAGYVSNVPKKGFNKAMGYRFAQESDLVEAIKPYLSAAGIHIAFSVESHDIIGQWPGRGTFPYILTHISMRYTVSDGKDTITGLMDGYGADAGDKGIFKAITGAKKYILMTLFMVDTGDDPERDRKDERTGPAVGINAGRAAAGLPRFEETELAEIGEETPPIPFTQTTRTDLVRGGRTTTATSTQKKRLTDLAREQEIGRRSLLRLMREELDKPYADAPEGDPATLGRYIDDALAALSPEEMGKLIAVLSESGSNEEPSGY